MTARFAAAPPDCCGEVPPRGPAAAAGEAAQTPASAHAPPSAMGPPPPPLPPARDLQGPFNPLAVRWWPWVAVHGGNGGGGGAPLLGTVSRLSR